MVLERQGAVDIDGSIVLEAEIMKESQQHLIQTDLQCPVCNRSFLFENGATVCCGSCSLTVSVPSASEFFSLLQGLSHQHQYGCEDSQFAFGYDNSTGLFMVCGTCQDIQFPC
jgi:hypothetical protein